MLPVVSRNWFPTLFDDLFDDNRWVAKMGVSTPAINIKEDAKSYVMEIAAPGIKKEYCRVNVSADGNLEIAIENKLEHKHDGRKEHYLRREFAYSNIQQQYQLPDDVERDGISACVVDGVLRVTLPKMTVEAEEKAVRQIAIE
ncbi:MAG: Hsp20/alpha crystallin family protein [Muribaculaceae bacterium]